jgi:hypothetical protein
MPLFGQKTGFRARMNEINRGFRALVLITLPNPVVDSSKIRGALPKPAVTVTVTVTDHGIPYFYAHFGRKTGFRTCMNEIKSVIPCPGL